MNTTTYTEESSVSGSQKPGALLAGVRMQKGYSTEYVAGKLHLRVNMIELLEADAYHKMPEPVFIKGYLRAYAKLLGVRPDPLLEVFNGLHHEERTYEKPLWQSRRVEPHRDHRMIRWMTALFAVGLLVAIGLWWQSSRGEQHGFFTAHSTAENATTASTESPESEIRLTDLSRMESLLSAPQETLTPLEQTGE